MAKEKKQKITFSYIAPGANKVELVGDFTGWQQAPLPMKKNKGGVWSKAVSLPPGRYEYRLVVDGEWRDDPQCAIRQPNQFGGENCVCVVEAATAAASALATPAKPESAAASPASLAGPAATARVKPAPPSALRA